jgi:TM2 domain-containing membrane protein YozV
MLSRPKDRRVAALLAFAGILLPGLHKFYLGQVRWGVCYLLLGWIMPVSISKIASVAEGFWYLFQDHEAFNRSFNGCDIERSDRDHTSAVSSTASIASVRLLADAIRQLEQLRQEGLISEYEFEQKRRQFIDRIG